ncbi:MAG TPA: PilZ domain-containing protein [Candidatus Sulfotelmatobacter sp.]|nr:PilZ domain-containing protein [Candidatus Sulfotelmatobacter sp.]
MQAGVSTARQSRAQYRHELRTLTYVTLDQGNGGIVRNLTHEGIGVRLVAGVERDQQLQVRLDLRSPKLRVETRGEVVWATLTGQCGIRFLDITPRMKRQIDEWILGNILENIPSRAERLGPMFAVPGVAEEDDGLIVSATPLKVIELDSRPQVARTVLTDADASENSGVELDWLSQPLSGRNLAWTVNTLVVVAALLMFAFVFLTVTREAPKWPLALSGGAAVFVAALYWGFFKMFGGSSLGARLARLAGSEIDEDEEAREDRFR